MADKNNQSPTWENLPVSTETAQAAKARGIDIYPVDTGFSVYDGNTGFSQEASNQSLDTVVQEAIKSSDRVWGKP